MYLCSIPPGSRLDYYPTENHLKLDYPKGTSIPELALTLYYVARSLTRWKYPFPHRAKRKHLQQLTDNAIAIFFQHNDFIWGSYRQMWSNRDRRFLHHRCHGLQLLAKRLLGCPKCTQTNSLRGKGGQVSPPLNISEIKTVQIRGNFLCPRGRVWPKKLGK